MGSLKPYKIMLAGGCWWHAYDAGATSRELGVIRLPDGTPTLAELPREQAEKMAAAMGEVALIRQLMDALVDVKPILNDLFATDFGTCPDYCMSLHKRLDKIDALAGAAGEYLREVGKDG